MTKHGNSEHDLLGGRYRILSKLGEGGMGAVWCAYDTLLDLRKVAIKTLPLHLLDDSVGFDRLKKEAQISLQLSHPNLAAVRSFEVHDGTPYLVMDYVEGQTLTTYIHEHGPMADIEVFQIFAPMRELTLLVVLEDYQSLLRDAMKTAWVHLRCTPYN